MNIHKNQYIITVGWDRELHIFSDLPHTIQTRQTENKDWKLKFTSSLNSHEGTSHRVGHKDDILAVAYGLPNFLATSSYDGEIIVWSMLSGHVFCRLILDTTNVVGNNRETPISTLLFLDTRASKRDSCSLISNGPGGKIYFWNLYNGHNPCASFQATKEYNIACITTDSDDLILGSGDSIGTISIWNITKFCLGNIIDQNPLFLRSWRGHIKKITSLHILEKQSLIISASIDHNVRLWTLKSQFIGTFGIDSWNIYDISTFKYPHSPEEVLKEPLNVPVTKKIICSNDCDERKCPVKVKEDKLNYEIDDNNNDYNGISNGKRLRNEKTRTSIDDNTGRTYQSISMNEMQSLPQCESLDSLIYSKSKDIFLTNKYN